MPNLCLVICSSLCGLVLLACPTPGGVDGGGSGGGGGSSADAGFVNLLPEVFASASGRAVAVRAGKVYVAGSGIRADAGSNNDFFLARFNPDLTRDLTFGTDGVALAVFDGGQTAAIPLDNDYPLALAFDADRVIVAGAARSFSLGTGDLGLAAFTTAGELDLTFGTGGTRADSFGVGAMLTTVSVPGDGGLVVTGKLDNGVRSGDLVVLRYTTNGAVDTSFTLTGMGAGGVIDCGFNLDEESRGVVAQGDRLVVGGGGGFCMVRVQPNGQLDPSFGPNGTGKLTNGNGFLEKLVERADGTLWGVGQVELNRDGGTGIEALWLKQVQLTPDGIGLPTFGTNGRRVDLLPEWGPIRGAALQADGKLLVYYAYFAMGRLLRLNPDGSLDTSFGTAGVLKLDITLPLLEGANGKGNHLFIDGTTAWVTDIDVVRVSPSATRQVLALVKIPL